MAGPAKQEGQGAGGRAGQQRKDDHRQCAQTGECERGSTGKERTCTLCQYTSCSAPALLLCGVVYAPTRVTHFLSQCLVSLSCHGVRKRTACSIVYLYVARHVPVSLQAKVLNIVPTIGFTIEYFQHSR